MAQDYLYKDIKGINESLKWLSEEKQRIHDQQTDLELNEGEYPLIDELKPQIKVYEELWTLQLKFSALDKTWQQGPLLNLDPMEVQDEHKQMYRLATKLVGKFDATNPKLTRPMGVASKMRDQLGSFKDYLPIIEALCNKGL